MHTLSLEVTFQLLNTQAYDDNYFKVTTVNQFIKRLVSIIQRL